MLKALGVMVASAFTPKLVDNIVDVVGKELKEAYEWAFGEEEEVEETKPQRKPRDTTVLTKQMSLYIRHYHEVTPGTGNEHAEELNKILGLNKSRSFYTRVWHKDADPYSLPEGEEIK